MKNKVLKRLTAVTCVFMIALSGALLSGCNQEPSQNSKQTEATSVQSVKQLGEGSIKFTLSVVDKDKNEKQFEISTDEKTVGDALKKLNLIEGEQGQYGLYIKSVDGVTADFNNDKTYWAFYINGEYAASGVDQTEVKNGEAYSLRIEK